MSQVSSRYITSSFLGHARADDLLEETMKELVQVEGMNSLTSISMDGPNVNLKFRGMLAKSVKEECGNCLLNVGTCGLHIIHNAFRKGHKEADWEVESFLSSLFSFFDQTSARREDYTASTSKWNSMMPLVVALSTTLLFILAHICLCIISESTKFPLQHCNHRWVENVAVAERAVEMWPSVKSFLGSLEKQDKKSQPKCASYSNLLLFRKNKFLLPQVHTYISIALVLQRILMIFQVDHPMLPFLLNEVAIAMKALIVR